ncbi:MAG: response regulator transcription factor [Bryobacterales bacterium]|nr:response regulator transcription factor [Bryobacterales bacterium]
MQRTERRHRSGLVRGSAEACYILDVEILVVDDDAELAGLVTRFLRKEGFKTTSVYDGSAGLEEALSGRFDLLVLDVMLPGLDGFAVLRKLREQSQIPVIMLTARGQEVDRITGLELGADDYLPKPFNPHELVARIKAIFRRMEPKSPSRSQRIEANGAVLDPAARSFTVDGERVELTSVEFDIMELLMRSAGRVLSRDSIIEALYGRKATGFEQSVNVHISHIRRKIEKRRPFIITVRGVGYQFCQSEGDVS